MPKSKHRKKHQNKLALYKANKKREQDALKKKMIEDYTKMQQEMLDNKEEHTSTEEVVGPEINIDELNIVDELNVDDIVNEFETIDLEKSIIENVEPEKIVLKENDNDNK